MIDINIDNYHKLIFLLAQEVDEIAKCNLNGLTEQANDSSFKQPFTLKVKLLLTIFPLLGLDRDRRDKMVFQIDCCLLSSHSVASKFLRISYAFPLLHLTHFSFLNELS